VQCGRTAIELENRAKDAGGGLYVQGKHTGRRAATVARNAVRRRAALMTDGQPPGAGVSGHQTRGRDTGLVAPVRDWRTAHTSGTGAGEHPPWISGAARGDGAPQTRRAVPMTRHPRTAPTNAAKRAPARRRVAVLAEAIRTAQAPGGSGQSTAQHTKAETGGAQPAADPGPS